jgi:HSP90 family molecular chaperone
MTTLPKILEINVEHPYIKKLTELYETNKDDPTLKEKIDILYQLSVLQSGFNIKDSNEFCKKMYSILI